MLAPIAFAFTLAVAPPPQEPATSAAAPIKIAVFHSGDATADGPNKQFQQGAAMVTEDWNDRGGVDGHTIEIVSIPCDDLKAAKGLVAAQIEAGVVAIIAPLDYDMAAAVAKAAKKKVPCLRFDPGATATITAIDRLAADILVRDLALLHDASRDSKALFKAMRAAPDDGGLPLPSKLVADITTRTKPKALQGSLQGAEAIVLDGDPNKLLEWLQDATEEGVADALKLPLLLTPRTAALLPQLEGREAYAIMGQSPATLGGSGGMRHDFEIRFQDIRYGAAEGMEAMAAALQAIDACDSLDSKAILKALDDIRVQCARGETTVAPKSSTLIAPLAAYRHVAGRLQPAYPPLIEWSVQQPTETGTARAPDPNLGEPFGTWRSRQFTLVPHTQWVLCTWGGERSTIERDLAALGLWTDGAVPLIDRIVKDELMARVIAITNTKFGHKPDGTPVPGKSLNISFATFEPTGVANSTKTWPARFMGDHPDTGGQAFGSHCQIYSTFIRRTIFQPHKLNPPVGPDDLTYIDGSYPYGTDHLRDKRSELIRALINGYAGAMALTNAHEVGHLIGLGHITDDPKGIMNVNEGAGLDYRDANFSTFSWDQAVEKIGLVRDRG